MTEAKLFDGEFPFTAEWYKGRSHAPHLEQRAHVHRLFRAAQYAEAAVFDYGLTSVVDLGCGDGGLLSLLDLCLPETPKWGYDLMETNVAAAAGREAKVRYADFLHDPIEWGELAICTETLEHLEDPHTFLREVASHAKAIVASSPVNESADNHDPVHAWAWDREGYDELLRQAGFVVVRASEVDEMFQVVLAQAV